MVYSEIHVWGDSLARGVVYNEERARYVISHERCTNRLQEELGCKVENHSMMGATVLEGYARFEPSTPTPRALCVVEFGGNDCDLDWKYVSEHADEPVRAKVELDVFADALRQFVQTIRERNMTPLLATPLPLHAQRYFAWVTRGLDADAVLHALGDVNHIYRWQERYAIAVRNVARETHCRVLDLRDVFLAQRDYEHLMCLDGIHPNDAGHRLLAEATLEKARAAFNAAPNAAWALEAAEACNTAIPSAARVS